MHTQTLTAMIALLLCSTALVGCDQDDKNDGNSVVIPDRNTPDDGTEAEPLEIFPEGTWESVGYGHQLHVIDGEATVFEVTGVSCIAVAELPQDQIIPELFSEVISRDNALHARESEGITRWKLVPESLDSRCASGGLPLPGDAGYQRDPVFVFDVLWQTFEDHYAFFEERNINWAQVREDVRPQISQDTTDEELFVALQEILAPFQDGHIGLNGLGESYSPPGPLDGKLEAEFEAQDELDDFEDYLVQELVRYLLAAAPLLSEEPRGDLSEVSWAHVDEKIGYLRVTHFEPDDPEERLQAVDQALTDLAETQVLILDIRLNSGGSDQVALDMLSRFVETPGVAFQKLVFHKGEFLNKYEVPTEALEGGPLYRGKVVLLTSRETVSAAEIFTLSARNLEQFTLMGYPTQGIFSDIFDRTLPNGWSFGLSNERYLSPEGENFEVVGIEPDVALERSSFLKEDREEGRDRALEEAIERVRAEL